MQEAIFQPPKERTPGEFSVYIEHSPTETYTRPHRHDFYELLFYRSGAATLYCNDAKIQVHAGDLVVINKGELHAMESAGGTAYYYIRIHPDFFAELPFDNIHIQKHIQNDETVKQAIYNLYEENCSNKPWCDMMLKSHAYAMMAHLLRNYTLTHSQKESAQLTAKEQRMDIVLSYIDKHYTDKISTRKLAALCHLNESYFCRCFKKTTGKSVLDYITDYRIEKASILLKKSTDTIAAIAAQVGFDDVTYFGKRFKAVMDVSPMQFRKQQTKKDRHMVAIPMDNHR